MCPRCEGMGSASDIDLTQLYDESKSLAEGAITVPGYTADGWSTRMYSESGFFDADKPIRDYTETELNDFLYKEPVKVRINGINLTYEGLVPKIQKSMLSKDVDALQPHIRAFVDRAVTFSSCPDCGGTRLNEAARSSKIERDQHRRRVRDADQRPGRVGPRPGRAVGGAAAGGARGEPRLVRRDGPGLPEPRPAVRHAVGRRGAAHEDDPPPRVVADRRHVRLRRADDRAARPRRRADEHVAPAPARQGQHGPRRRARRGGDPGRRPRRRHGPRRRSPRRDGRVRGHGRRPHRVGDGHRPPPRRPPGAEAGAAGAARARSRSGTPGSTTSGTSRSTCRSACSSR